MDATKNTDGSVRSDSLPPTLCHHCKFGVVVKEASPIHEDDDVEFWLREIRAISREVSFCRNPSISGDPREPAEMPFPVLECQGFVDRPMRVTKGCPEKRALRAARHGARETRRARRGRRGR